MTFDGSDNPTALGGTAIADLNKALELAQQNDVYLMLCLFSFDGFRPTGDESGIRVRGLRPIAIDATKRKMLMNNVVRPFARAAEASPHRSRLIAWDVINEPEWAITGPSPYGDQAYDPNPGPRVGDPRANGDVRQRHDRRAARRIDGDGDGRRSGDEVEKGVVTTDVDFYQFHIYDWVNQYWPYNRSPGRLHGQRQAGRDGRIPGRGVERLRITANLLASFYATGYSGALGWHYAEATPAQMDAVKAFADLHVCETKY